MCHVGIKKLRDIDVTCEDIFQSILNSTSYNSYANWIVPLKTIIDVMPPEILSVVWNISNLLQEIVKFFF